MATSIIPPKPVKDVRCVGFQDWQATVYVDGSPVECGFYRSRFEAEDACNDYVYQALMRQPVVTPDEVTA